MRTPVVGVMGGSKATPEVAAMAERLGGLIAARRWILLNGGRDCGVMAASARGAKRAGGMVIGVLPDMTTARASPDLDVAIVTGLSDARNLINVLSSDVVIACPGSLGTMSEIVLALKHDKPVILLGVEVGPHLAPYENRGQLIRVETPEEVVEQVAAVLPGTKT
jgi:uncharacterized protein (TIGR00725 family)